MKILQEGLRATANKFLYYFIFCLVMLPAFAQAQAQAQASEQQLNFAEWIESAWINAHDRPLAFQQQALLHIQAMEESGSNEVYQVYLLIADSFVETGKYSESRQYLRKALETTKVQQTPELKVDTLFNIGLSHSDQKNFVKTYEYFALALRSAKKFNLVCHELEIKTEIGSLLTELADYTGAKEVMNSVPIGSDCPRFTYQTVLARLLAEQGEYDASFELYEKFLAAAADRESLAYQTDIKAEYVPYLVKAGRLKRAEEVVNEVIDAMQNKGIRHSTYFYELAIATVLSAKGQHQEAIEYARIALADDVELSPALRLKRDNDVLPLLVSLYEELGKPAEGQILRARLLANNTEYFSNNRSALLGVAEARFNVAEREGEIAFISQEVLVNKLRFERLLLISILGSLIATVIVIWSIYLYGKNTRERIFFEELKQQNEVLNKRALGAESELAEKETLFDEAHHRLKNNLHFLLNLFEVQRSRLNSSAASQISDVLLDATNRVHAMAVIHQFSYGADRGDSVSTSDLLNNLVEQTFDVGNGSVTINVDCRDVDLDDEASKSVVLIVNELLCNAQKHAFDGQKDGKIDISLGQGVGDYKNQLTVVDNGKGFSKELLNQTKRSMGLRLVRSMVKQLDGVLDVDSGSFGTRWTIDF